MVIIVQFEEDQPEVLAHEPCCNLHPIKLAEHLLTNLKDAMFKMYKEDSFLTTSLLQDANVAAFNVLPGW